MSAHGKNKKRKRGCHKRATSPEVIAWQKEHLPPERPPWMNEKTYAQLAKLRFEL
jgi:hypothetical protein